MLMRALRDFNMPKVVTEDVTIFLGLLGDLFPGLEVERERDCQFEKAVRKTTAELRLQPEETFVLKVWSHTGNGRTTWRMDSRSKGNFLLFIATVRWCSWRNSWQCVTLSLFLEAQELGKARLDFFFTFY